MLCGLAPSNGQVPFASLEAGWQGALESERRATVEGCDEAEARL